MLQLKRINLHAVTDETIRYSSIFSFLESWPTIKLRVITSKYRLAITILKWSLVKYLALELHRTLRNRKSINLDAYYSLVLNVTGCESKEDTGLWSLVAFTQFPQLS